MSPVSCQPPGGGFELAWIVGPVIADHDVWPPHEEPAALLDAGHGLEARLDERQEPPDRPDFVERRRVDGEHRRSLGDAVALENAQAELLDIKAPRLGLDRLRSSDDVTQRAETNPAGVARIVGQERVRAQ